MTADRVDRFEADISESPDALERLVDAWAAVEIDPRQRVVFVGLGSSRYAAEVVIPLLRARGRSAWVDVAGSRPATRPADDLTLVAISASGRTPEVIEAADLHRGRGRVVAVTNRRDSSLASMADQVVPLHAGEETAGIACRTFRATIAALALLTSLTTRDELRVLAGDLETSLAEGATTPDDVARLLDGADAIDVLADGPMLGVAEQGALMLREAPRLPAHAWPTGEWLHTGVYLTWPGHRVVLFPGSDSDGDVDEVVARRGSACIRVPTLRSNPVERAILESLTLESVAAALWRRAHATELKRP